MTRAMPPLTPLPTSPPPVWARHLRREVQYLIDLSVLVAAFVLAYALRFDFQIPQQYIHVGLVQLPVVVLLQFVIILLTGLYRFVWRYMGLAELVPFVRGAAYSAVPLLLMRILAPATFRPWSIPLSVILLDTLLAFGGLVAIRVLRRTVYERYERNRRESVHRGRRKPVLLVGAGRAGVLAVREIQNRGDLDLRVVGFVDDDPMKQGALIHGVPVLGDSSDLLRLVKEHNVDHVVITIAEAPGTAIREIVTNCERSGVAVKIIPGLYELIEGRVSISRFRNVGIEDLLGRDPVRLDEEIVREFIDGRSVLITGAGGSIGSELCRQVARFSPRRVLLAERAEGALFDVDRELRQLWPDLQVVPLVVDIGDEERVRALFSRFHPDVVLHAAAHKHVPLMESNPTEAIKNNVLATRTLARLAGEAMIQAFVLISTDKAVRPTSVMGASKRIAELVTQALHREYPSTRFVAVRFGNVLGSAGSVVPIFREQIAKGGPVTVTHPDATRYFMTIPEASQLVLEAGALGQSGEILILDMGQPVSILELAKDMISLSGFEPFTEIPIRFTGLRPGEKLIEELEMAGEEMDRTRHPKIFIGRMREYSEEEVQQCLDRFRDLAARGDEEGIRRALRDMIPEAQFGGPSGSTSRESRYLH